MNSASFAFDFAPILPLWLIAALAAVCVLALVPAALRRARGVWWRAGAFALVLGALSQPRLVEQTRETRPDIALLLVDRSDSTTVSSNHAAAIETARRNIEARLGRMRDLELRVVDIPEGGNQGTRAFAALERALADIPAARLAGVMLLSDGQVHDVPADGTGWAPGEGVPLHLLMPGRQGEVDRRIRLIEAPGFGIVGRSVELRLIVEDLGVPRQEGVAQLTIRRDGAAPITESVPVGREHRITLPIERAGPSVIDLVAETRPGEVSDVNNRVVVAINGVRDRLRVLLVSGEPHAGERTWRRLLKADPGVDLVHFTILRPPEKDDLTPLNELALIAFPVRELFQVKLRDFDLVVFDRFANRGILPPSYMRNIAEYVRAGGALLVSVGPEFVGPTSLAATPLGAVLPARPLNAQQAILEQAYRPRISIPGSRHPVTEGLPGANSETAEPSWGRWYRTIRTEARAGTTVMEGAGGAPLLILDRVGQGRVALMLSDHIWLWSRGHDGGGPQQELLRRTAHWLMREPELEEEDLTARIEAGRLSIARRSLDAGAPPEVTITAPDGTTSRVPLSNNGGGRASADAEATAPGLWQVNDGRRQAFAAAMPANPPEFADLRADPARVQSLVQATGGAARWFGDGAAVPDIRSVSVGRDAQGAGWIGLRRRDDHTVTGIAALPLLPAWLMLPLLLGVAILAWRSEAR
ncbi:MAG: putative rane associated protein [Rubritepida sp.]|nr:putative rane associated protein [Rubritepida sp.]